MPFHRGTLAIVETGRTWMCGKGGDREKDSLVGINQVTKLRPTYVPTMEAEQLHGA